MTTAKKKKIPPDYWHRSAEIKQLLQERIDDLDRRIAEERAERDKRELSGE